MYHRFTLLDARLLFALTVLITGCTPDANPQAVAATKTEAQNQPIAKRQQTVQQSVQQSTTCRNDRIYQAYQAQNPNQKIQVLGCGEVVKLLKDDNDGSRHQKFLIKLTDYPKLTLLVAHNIDLAPRIDNLKPHTPIQFYGEYIYNPKGGVIHWTHHDPASRHQDGWLMYQGKNYG